MDGGKVGVLEEADEVGFGGFLKGKDCGSLEAEIRLVVLGDLTNKTLEWQLADEELSGLLVTSDLTKSDGSGSISVWFLHTACGGCGFASCLRGELLSWGLATGGFSCCLLCTGHFAESVNL